MPLRQIAVALALALIGSASPAFAQQSHLPGTLPGLSRDEGTFLVTSSDDGTRVVYFIAQNARHAILDSDLQVEQQLNPLWPIRTTTRDEVLAYPEGDPIGRARVGALDAPEAVVAADAAADADEGVAANPVAVAEEPAVEAAVEPATTEDDQPQTTYVVKPGDSAIGIARDLGVDVDQLLAANGVTNRNRIYVGQVLTVPAQSS